MADDAQLAVLKQGAKAWNGWRAAHSDIRPDLSNASLRGLDLVNADLSRADLRRADLRGTNLSSTVLVGADLTGANFFKALVDGADVSGANLTGAKFFNCPQLIAARNWQSAFRDSDLACGAPIPPNPGRL